MATDVENLQVSEVKDLVDRFNKSDPTEDKTWIVMVHLDKEIKHAHDQSIITMITKAIKHELLVQIATADEQLTEQKKTAFSILSTISKTVKFDCHIEILLRIVHVFKNIFRNHPFSEVRDLVFDMLQCIGRVFITQKAIVEFTPEEFFGYVKAIVEDTQESSISWDSYAVIYKLLLICPNLSFQIEFTIKLILKWYSYNYGVDDVSNDCFCLGHDVLALMQADFLISARLLTQPNPVLRNLRKFAQHCKSSGFGNELATGGLLAWIQERFKTFPESFSHIRLLTATLMNNKGTGFREETVSELFHCIASQFENSDNFETRLKVLFLFFQKDFKLPKRIASETATLEIMRRGFLRLIRGFRNEDERKELFCKLVYLSKDEVFKKLMVPENEDYVLYFELTSLVFVQISRTLRLLCRIEFWRNPDEDVCAGELLTSIQTCLPIALGEFITLEKINFKSSAMEVPDESDRTVNSYLNIIRQIYTFLKSTYEQVIIDSQYLLFFYVSEVSRTMWWLYYYFVSVYFSGLRLKMEMNEIERTELLKTVLKWAKYCLQKQNNSEARKSYGATAISPDFMIFFLNKVLQPVYLNENLEVLLEEEILEYIDLYIKTQLEMWSATEEINGNILQVSEFVINVIYSDLDLEEEEGILLKIAIQLTAVPLVFSKQGFENWQLLPAYHLSLLIFRECKTVKLQLVHKKVLSVFLEHIMVALHPEHLNMDEEKPEFDKPDKYRITSRRHWAETVMALIRAVKNVSWVRTAFIGKGHTMIRILIFNTYKRDPQLISPLYAEIIQNLIITYCNCSISYRSIFDKTFTNIALKKLCQKHDFPSLSAAMGQFIEDIN